MIKYIGVYANNLKQLHFNKYLKSIIAKYINYNNILLFINHNVYNGG